MRISTVPAQITTVEDRLAGSITIRQATLLSFPVIFGFSITLIFPPMGQFVLYKILVVIGLFLVFGILAIRIKDRIIIQWLRLLIIYIVRPRYYLYDKNSTYLRNIKISTEKHEIEIDSVLRHPIIKTSISPKELARLREVASDIRAEMKFEIGKKGELNVHITEVK